MRKRLRKFIAATPGLSIGDNPEAVHGARVWSRRVQEGITALFPRPRPKKVRKIRRGLHQARRILGEWRNCDVVIALVEKKQRRARSPVKKSAWELAHRRLVDRRARQMSLAHRKLSKHAWGDFAARLEKLLDRSARQTDNELTAALGGSVEAARNQWRSALDRAKKSGADADLHAFRIAIKRFRYRIELLRDLGDKETKPTIRWLKRLQQALGKWHDHQIRDQMMAEVLARPEILLREFEAVRVLLGELAKDRRRQEAVVQEIFRAADELPQRGKGGVNGG